MASGRLGHRGRHAVPTANTTGAAYVRTQHRRMAADTAREMTWTLPTAMAECVQVCPCSFFVPVMGWGGLWSDHVAVRKFENYAKTAYYVVYESNVW